MRKNLPSLNVKCLVSQPRSVCPLGVQIWKDAQASLALWFNTLTLLQVRWFKDGSEIRKGKKYEIISKGAQRILIIHKSVFDDEAEYECDARTSKSSGILTVIGK